MMKRWFLLLLLVFSLTTVQCQLAQDNPVQHSHAEKESLEKRQDMCLICQKSCGCDGKPIVKRRGPSVKRFDDCTLLGVVGHLD